MTKLRKSGRVPLEDIPAKSPKYAVLAAQLRNRILQHEFNVGDRLPSFTELRSQYGATPTTVERIYGLLEQEGLVERRQGIGTFVKKPQCNVTGNIGFIGNAFSKKRQHPFFGHLMEGVQKEIESRQRHLLYMGTDHSLNLSAAGKIDGVLICNIDNAGPVLRQLPADLPRVSLLNIAEGITSVVADDYGGAMLAVRHLIENGHRRIACLMEKLPSLARRRYAGYADALLQGNIEGKPEWARLTPTVRAAVTSEQAYLEWSRTQMRDWLQEGWLNSQCTAILVQNDVAAIGVMQVLQEAGIRIPQQVSVIGFDGTEICDLVVPRLTTMQLPLEQIGTKGVAILDGQIRDGKPEAQIIVLPMSLRPGDSVGPPP